MIKLYLLPGCPYCKMVLDKLNELKLEHEVITAPRAREERKEVFEVSGQYLVPVMVDGEVMLDDEVTILPYLETKYGNQ